MFLFPPFIAYYLIFIAYWGMVYEGINVFFPDFSWPKNKFQWLSSVHDLIKRAFLTYTCIWLRIRFKIFSRMHSFPEIPNQDAIYYQKSFSMTFQDFSFLKIFFFLNLLPFPFSSSFIISQIPLNSIHMCTQISLTFQTKMQFNTKSHFPWLFRTFHF